VTNKELTAHLKSKGFAVTELTSGILVYGDVNHTVCVEQKDGKDKFPMRKSSWENPVAVYDSPAALVQGLKLYGQLRSTKDQPKAKKTA
jgi:hypothetical protein